MVNYQRRRHVAVNLIISQRCSPWNILLVYSSLRVGDRTRTPLFGDAPLSSSGNSVSLVCAEPMPALFSLRYPVPSSLPWNVRRKKETEIICSNCSGEIEFLDETELVEVDLAQRQFHNGDTMFTNSFRPFYLTLCLPHNDISINLFYR